MKEHIQRELVNELKKIAIKYHDYGCLRELIASCVRKYMEEDIKHSTKGGGVM